LGGNETIETHACAFLTLNILAIDRVPTKIKAVGFEVMDNPSSGSCAEI
jgi:hypothetical protein